MVVTVQRKLTDLQLVLGGSASSVRTLLYTPLQPFRQVLPAEMKGQGSYRNCMARKSCSESQLSFRLVTFLHSRRQQQLKFAETSYLGWLTQASKLIGVMETNRLQTPPNAVLRL